MASPSSQIKPRTRKAEEWSPTSVNLKPTYAPNAFRAIRAGQLAASREVLQWPSRSLDCLRQRPPAIRTQRAAIFISPPLEIAHEGGLARSLRAVQRSTRQATWRRFPPPPFLSQLSEKTWLASCKSSLMFHFGKGSASYRTQPQGSAARQ